MQSAEKCMASKSIIWFRFLKKKIQESRGGCRFPDFKRRKSVLSTTPSLKEKIPFRVPSTPALLWQTMKFFRKRKWTCNRLKCLRIHHFHPFFRKISRGGPWISLWYWVGDTAASLRGWSSTPSSSGSTFWIRQWQCNIFFDAILLKVQLSLSEFKRLYIHSRLHHFASFFQNFLGGGPPNPHQQEGKPLPYPPQSALRASRKPPQVEFWIRHCF